MATFLLQIISCLVFIGLGIMGFHLSLLFQDFHLIQLCRSPNRNIKYWDWREEKRNVYQISEHSVFEDSHNIILPTFHHLLFLSPSPPRPFFYGSIFVCLRQSLRRKLHLGTLIVSIKLRGEKIIKKSSHKITLWIYILKKRDLCIPERNYVQ